MGSDPIGTPPADTVDLDADVSNNGIYDPAVFDAAHAQIITAGADNTWGTADDLVKSVYEMDPSELQALGTALKALPQSELDKIYAKGDDKLDAFVKNLLGADQPDPTPKPDPDWAQFMKLIMALLCRPQQGGGGSCGSGGGQSGGGSSGGGQSGGGCGSGSGLGQMMSQMPQTSGMGMGCGTGMGMNPMGQQGMGMGQNMGPYNYAYGNGNLFNNQNQNAQGQKGFDVNGDGKNDMFAVPMGNGQSIMIADANGNGQLDQGDSIIGMLPVMGQNHCGMGMGMNGMDMLPQMFGAMPWMDDKARTGAAPQIVINIQAPSQFFAQANS